MAIVHDVYDAYQTMRDEDLDKLEVALWRTRKAAQAMRNAQPKPETIPADMAARVQANAMAAMHAEFDAILDDLRSGRTEPLVRFTTADHDMMEREQPGAYEARTL